MTALEKAARAAEHAYYNDSGSTGEPIEFEAIVRAVLMAVREPDDEFMMRMYPNPTLEVADAGRAAGARSRRAGRMQIARFVDTLLNEEPK